MRNTAWLAALLATELFGLPTARAQGTLYVSNLSQTSQGIVGIGSDTWLGQSFRTGTNSEGYLLNSAQLLMGATQGQPNGLNISLYSVSRNVPGINLGNFSGSIDPDLAGIYDFGAPTGVTLSANTTYFIVATSATHTSPDSYYAWSVVYNSSATEVNGWTIGGGSYSLDNGSSWTQNGRSIAQIGIYATTVPEPAVRTVFVAGLGALGFWRLRRRRA